MRCKYWGLIFVLVGFILSVAGFGASADSGNKDSVKVGISCPLTGPLSKIGKGYLEGWELYFKKANSEGGINGKRIEWKVLDDGGEEAKAESNTKSLIDWGADVLAGYVGGPAVRAAVDYIEREGEEVAFFFPLTSERFIKEDIKDKLYSIDPFYFDEIELMLTYFMREKGIYNMGIVYDDTCTSKFLADEVKYYISKFGVKPIMVNVNDTMARTQLIEFHPDLIVLAASTDESMVFFEEMIKKIDAKRFPYVVAFSSVFPWSYIKKIADKIVGCKFYFTQVVPHPKDLRYEVVREYLEAIHRFSPDIKPCFISLHGYIAAKLMVEILRKAKGTSVFKIFTLAEATPIDVGLDKPVRFSPVLHRIPLGVGLFCVKDKGPRIQRVLWNDFYYKGDDDTVDRIVKKTGSKEESETKQAKVSVKIKSVSVEDKAGEVE